MGKSPGKWIKTVLFRKKPSKSNLSKDGIPEMRTSITGKAQSKDFLVDSMVISSPVTPAIISSREDTELEKSSSANLRPDTSEDLRSSMEFNVANGEELIKLEQAATKAQASFRGYVAPRAFWELKGIIWLQALVRGHLVRRQAVATLKCMRAIVEFQALVRGRKVRLSNGQMIQKYTPQEFVDKNSSDLLGTSLRVEKLSTNVFATKLVGSFHTTTPLSIQYESVEPNSVRNWLDRWSTSSFWELLPQPKKTLNTKPKRKPTKLQTEETETGRSKRIVHRISAANGDNSLTNSSENEKSKRTVRKVNLQPDSGQEQSINELEKVKRNLRKISVSTSVAPEKPETDTEKPSPGLNKKFSEHGINHGSEKNPGSTVESLKQPEPEPEPEEPLVQDEHPPIEPPSLETVEKVENEPPVNVESNGKETQKARRRKSLSAKQEYHESVSPNTPTVPSYMAATESAKAKLRAQAAEEVAENGSSGRQSLPSPRVQKPLQGINGKGGSKPKKSQISPRDEKVIQTGWRR